MEALEEAGYTVRRVAGADRYETAVALAEDARSRGAGVEPTLLASGASFADALAAAAAAHALGGRLLLTAADELPPPTADRLAADRADVRTVLVVGGLAAIGANVVDAVRAAISGGRSATPR